MSYHIIDIGESVCELHWKKGQLLCFSSGERKSIPLEDVASIVVTSFQAQVSSLLISEAARNGISMVFCERYKPVSILLPANRATDTQLVRSQIKLPRQFRDRLWSKTVDAKCSNQLMLLLQLNPASAGLNRMNSLVAGNSLTKEAECARIYWRLYSEILHPGRRFVRARKGGTLNNLLNYAYAVLLSLVLQRLFAVGIDPTFGISHVVRAKSTPLAYDVMEPFRPFMDARVAAWLRDHGYEENSYDVSRDFKQFLSPVLSHPLMYAGVGMEMQQAVEKVIRSFRQAIIQQQIGLYTPWKQTTTKWAGYS